MASFFGKINSFDRKSGTGSIQNIDTKKLFKFKIKEKEHSFRKKEVVVFEIKKTKKGYRAYKVKKISIFE
jgi:hypothetical protein